MMNENTAKIFLLILTLAALITSIPIIATYESYQNQNQNQKETKPCQF